MTCFIPTTRIKEILDERGYSIYEEIPSVDRDTTAFQKGDFRVKVPKTPRTQYILFQNSFIPFNTDYTKPILHKLFNILENVNENVYFKRRVYCRSVFLYDIVKHEPFLELPEYATSIILEYNDLFLVYQRAEKTFTFIFRPVDQLEQVFEIGVLKDLNANDLTTITDLFHEIKTRSTKRIKTLLALDLVLNFDKIKGYCDKHGYRFNLTGFKDKDFRIAWNLDQYPHFAIEDKELKYFCVYANRDLSFLDNLKTLLNALKTNSVRKKLYAESVYDGDDQNDLYY